MARLPHLLAAAILTCSAASAAAQSDQRLNGVVRDATGSGLGGATVTATNQATNECREATTHADGSYPLSLPPGTYTVSVSATGFRRSVQTVQLGPGPSKPLDFRLDTQLSEEIFVTATKRQQTLLEVPFSVAAPT